jgi:hypothetical protein
MSTISRRDICKIGFSAVTISTGVDVQAAQADETIVRSNRLLTIGLNRKTGRAFIEQNGSGETWLWDWRQVRAADLRSFSGDRRSLKALQPDSIRATADGFALDYREY